MEPDTAPDAAPDPGALRRRVLLTGVVTFAAYLTTAYVLTVTGAPSWLLFPGLVIIVVLVVRPLMRPVFAANRLRRALAYQAFLDGKGLDGKDRPRG